MTHQQRMTHVYAVLIAAVLGLAAGVVHADGGAARNTLPPTAAPTADAQAAAMDAVAEAREQAASGRAVPAGDSGSNERSTPSDAEQDDEVAATAPWARFWKN